VMKLLRPPRPFSLHTSRISCACSGAAMTNGAYIFFILISREQRYCI
jgi:hypothetical protein